DGRPKSVQRPAGKEGTCRGARYLRCACPQSGGRTRRAEAAGSDAARWGRPTLRLSSARRRWAADRGGWSRLRGVRARWVQDQGVRSKEQAYFTTRAFLKIRSVRPSGRGASIGRQLRPRG